MHEFDKVKYNNAYNKQNYANVQFKIRKDEKQNLLILAKKKGHDTISAYAKALLEEALAKESGGGANLN